MKERHKKENAELIEELEYLEKLKKHAEKLLGRELDILRPENKRGSLQGSMNKNMSYLEHRRIQQRNQSSDESNEGEVTRNPIQTDKKAERK